MSRVALARRFNDVVGQSPMTFLTGWRIVLAADLLLEPGATMASVANEVGYSLALSAAFNACAESAPQQHRTAP